MLGQYGHVYSCKCAEERTLLESFKGSSVIVHGRVIGKRLTSFRETMTTASATYVREKLKEDKEKLKLFLSDLVFEVRLVVIESFKGGKVGDTLTIYTTTTSGSCGIKFDLEKEYIVYTLKRCHQYFLFLKEEEEKKGAVEKENTYWVHACTRTAGYVNSEAVELRNLGKGNRE